MLKDKAKEELSAKDYKFLKKLVARGLALLTKDERAHLLGRKDYLSKETVKELDNLKEEDLNKDEGENEDGAEASPYASMNAGDLKKLCKKRGIEGVSKVDEMREALEADDNGELEEEEE